MSREIVIPHDLTRGPLKGLRRILVQGSLSDLKEGGYFERYARAVSARELTEISDAIGPGWLPIELTLAHYRACEDLRLSEEQIREMGKRSGARMQGALLVGVTKSGGPGEASPWETLGAFWRMGRRVYDGSSSQYTKLGPKELQIETVGNPLFSIHYYRVAHLAFLREAFGAFGVNIQAVRPISYRADGDRAEVCIRWT